MSSKSSEFLLTNCPRDCYDGCGILVEKREDRVIVRGNPDHPISRGSLCRKCTHAYNNSWQDPQVRLLYPLRRSGPKGSGQFQRISWEEALSEIATSLGAVLEEHGGGAVMNAHYSGTLSLTGFFFPMRFFHAIGADEADPDSICNAAGHAAWQYLYGESCLGFDPRTISDSSCVLLWGANPAHAGPHVFEHWFAASEATRIVVDPVRTRTAQAADIHLQPRPSSDAALAFAMAHVMRDAGLIDKAWVAGHVLGFDELEPLLDDCTPQWGEQQTGVPAEKIIEAAKAYGAGPSLLWAGQALSRQIEGGNIMRSVGMLPALSGNIGKPGAGFYYLNITPALAGLDVEDLLGVQLLQRERKAVHYGELADVMLSDKYRCFFSWNTNPLGSAPQQDKLRKALTREDLFTVVSDCFQTDTADYADIILPAASFLEYDDLTFSYFNLLLGVQRKVREPLGESLPNAEIFRRLATAMNMNTPALSEPQETLIARMCEQMKIEGGFNTLAEKGWQWMTRDTRIFWAEGQFPTPSGRVEIASEAAEQAGHPRLPHPEARAPAKADDELHLLSPASDYRVNGSYANDAGLAERAGPAQVHVSPADIARLGLSEGAPVTVSSTAAQLQAQVHSDPALQAGTALIYKGRWPKLEAGGRNVNALHDGAIADFANGNAIHSLVVKITPC